MSKYDELVAKHGTLQEFSDAVWGAICEITVDEASAAVEKYRDELAAAVREDETT